MAGTTVGARQRSGCTDEYLRLIGAGDETGAIDLVAELLDEGMPAEQVLLDVIAGAQTRVGELWARNDWSVAQEHAATAISERAVAAVAARARVRPTRGRVTAACVDGEWHALPMRIVAEVLRLRGWRVDFLGADVPGPHLVTHLHQTDAHSVALSCMLPARLPRAHAAIVACHAAGVPVIAGGPGFGPDGRYAYLLGADAWVARADGAANRLAAADWPPSVTAEPKHVADAEYRRIVADRPRLIGEAMRRLPEVYPPARGYDEGQLDATVADYGHITDFLAAALYVDDVAVLTDFVRWTVPVLVDRGVPASALTVGLRLYREVVADLPRAAAMLDEALPVSTSIVD